HWMFGQPAPPQGLLDTGPHKGGFDQGAMTGRPRYAQQALGTVLWPNDQHIRVPGVAPPGTADGKDFNRIMERHLPPEALPGDNQCSIPSPLACHPHALSWPNP